MPEFIQPEIKTVGLGEKIYINELLGHSDDGMTQEEFLELMGKGSEDEDKELIAAIEKVLNKKEIDHSDESEDYIMHYGRKGMKWGQNLFKTDSSEMPTGQDSTSDVKTESKNSQDSELKATTLNNEIQMALDYLNDITPENVNPNDLKNLKDIRDSILYLAKDYADSIGLPNDEFLDLLRKLQSKFNGVNNIYKRMFSLEKAYKSNPKTISRSEYFDITHSDDSLEHHGIDGQKWGVRNGPPYPLERQKMKKSSVQSKAKQVLKEADDLTLDELRVLAQKIEWEKKLSDIAFEEKGKNNTFINEALKTAGKTMISVAVPIATKYLIKQIFEKAIGDQVEVIVPGMPTKKS